MSTSIHDIPVRRITGEDTNLGEYSGKVLLVVNVASKCGLTPQYEALEKLYRNYRDRGLVVTGFPANDFRGHEPGSNDEIQTFCTSTFGVDFLCLKRSPSSGKEKHPLYKELIAAQPKATSTSDLHFSEKLKGHGIEPTTSARNSLELREVHRRPQRQSNRPVRAQHRSRRSGAGECPRKRTSQKLTWVPQRPGAPHLARFREMWDTTNLNLKRKSGLSKLPSFPIRGTGHDVSAAGLPRNDGICGLKIVKARRAGPPNVSPARKGWIRLWMTRAP